MNSARELTVSTDIPLLGLAAYSGTGKTTLLTRLISIFRQQGLRVGVIKHAHHSFEIDHPGKDSYELRKSGASQVLIGSSKRWALIVEDEQDNEFNLETCISKMMPGTLDIIMVEGFKLKDIPKIELNRSILGRPLLHPTDSSIIALATDDFSVPVEIPVLDLNQPDMIAGFIIERFLPQHKILDTLTGTEKTI